MLAPGERVDRIFKCSVHCTRGDHATGIATGPFRVFFCSCCGPHLSLLVHLSTTVFVLLRLRVKIKECSRKLNQHGHEWTMRIDAHTIERQEELMEFCGWVEMDREENDERAELDRTKDLKSNPKSVAFKTAQRSLAEKTGGQNFDRF